MSFATCKRLHTFVYRNQMIYRMNKKEKKLDSVVSVRITNREKQLLLKELQRIGSTSSDLLRDLIDKFIIHSQNKISV